MAKTFAAEAAGLRALRAAGAPLRIPEVVVLDEAFLLLEWIDQGPKQAGFDAAFGRALAELHRHEGPGYGFEMDNFIGRSPQYNALAGELAGVFQDLPAGPAGGDGAKGGAVAVRMEYVAGCPL